MAVAFKDEYLRMDEMYEGQTYKMAANTLMTWPTDIDASRLYMNTSETKQSLTLLNPDVPRLSNGWENVLGKLNRDRSYKQLKGTWEIKDIVKKYSEGNIYTIVIYNEEKNLWDMIEKPIAENLGEKFGFVFNTDKMDSLKKGDIITDEIVYKSTAYDKHMNYRYGKNAKVLYTTSTGTFEDAIKIRRGWAEGVRSVEIDNITASVNNNHIPLNIYGDDTHYQVIPKFGEPIQNSRVFTTRPKNNSRILNDFENSALMEVNDTTDSDYVVSEALHSEVYDIDIYYNGKEPFPDNSFFHQLKVLYDEQEEYANNLLNWTIRIKESGDNYTKNVTQIKSKYQDWVDPEYDFCGKEKNKPFGYMTIKFKTKSILGIVPGSKMAGRFGDKGVVSKESDNESVNRMMEDGTIDSILDMLGRPITDEEREKIAGQIEIIPDSEMPYTDDFPVDILLNASGAIRRLNPGQICEVDLNFCSEAIRKKVCEFETIEEKEDLIFEYLGMLNEAECDFFYEMYHSFDTRVKVNDRVVVLSDMEEKNRFIQNIEEHGFYIRKPLDSPIRYEAIKRIYERFDFIKPLPIYIDIFGTKKRRIIKDAIVADKYMMILKHNSNKNFSARSTFRVSRANLPTKDTTKRDNRSQYSKSPVRIGEAYNLMSSISGRLLAEYNIFMRSSSLGRKSLRRILETEGNPLEIKRMKVKDNFINANADIFNAKFKAIGLRLNFMEEGNNGSEIIEDAIMPLQFGKYTIYDSPLRRPLYNKLFIRFIETMKKYLVVEEYKGQKEDLVWDEVFKCEDIKELNVPEEIKEMLCSVTKGEDPKKNLKNEAKNK